MNKMAAEMVGTFALVLLGCGSAVLGGFPVVGQLGIAFAFGLTIVAMAYGIGPVSGCHLNPAVSFGLFVAQRMKLGEMGRYILAQCVGAVLGAGVLYLIASGVIGYDIRVDGLGQNGFGPHSPAGYSVYAGFLFEVVATFLFVVVILGVTQKNGENAFAGLAIGLTLTVIHIVGIQVTGVSVNPARSLGPALFVQGDALAQLWLFIAAPLIGAALAGLAFRAKILSA
jgi:aquaporin Z